MSEGRLGMVRNYGHGRLVEISKDPQKKAKEGIPEQELSALEGMGTRLGVLRVEYELAK